MKISSFLNLAVSICLWGCDANPEQTNNSECDLEGPCLCVDVKHDASQNKVRLEFIESENAFYENCMNPINIFAVDPETGAKRAVKIRPNCYVGGCYVEDEFLEPHCDEGCDMIFWSPLEQLHHGEDFELALYELTQTGEALPPAGFEHCAWWGEDAEARAPTAYPVYEWHELAGEIEIELEFGCGTDPHAGDTTRHTDSFSLTI